MIYIDFNTRQAELFLKFIKSIKQTLNNIEYKKWHFPVFLLGLMIIAYALFINQLGFYWDDWTQLLVSRLYGSEGYWAYFATDRPTSAWTHALLVPVLGFKPLHWQIFTLLMRWATVIAMWYTLQLIWPRYKRTITLAAFLFAVYPAFIQQAPSVAYHQHWLQFALYFASLICMIYSVRKGKLNWVWMVAALLLQALQLSITEFFAGIELIRPVILWIVFTQETGKQKRLIKTALSWLPYLLLLAGFTMWRLFLSNIPKNEPSLLYDVAANPFNAGKELFRLIITDQIYIVISSWARVFNLDFETYGEGLIIGSWVAAIILALLLWGIFTVVASDKTGEEQSRKQMLWLGCLVTLVGPAPIWLAGKNMLVDNDFHVDRFAMASMWGISLVIVVLVERLIRDRNKTALAMAILVAISAGLQIRVAGDYSSIWKNQQSFYWQLLWRAPYIEPDTALVSNDTILAHQELFSTGSAINHLYPQSGDDGRLAYWMYRLTPAYDEIGINDNPSFNTHHRIYQFNGTLNDSLVISYDLQNSTCLWVLSDIDANNPYLPAIVQQAAVHSNLDRIKAQPHEESGYPPVEMIGKEPLHDWCFLYQKSELAAQNKQWQKVLDFLSEADEKGYQPGDGITHAREWMPALQALIKDGQLARAEELSQTLIDENGQNRAMICFLWMNEEAGEENEAEYMALRNEFMCELR
jgi:hypothetical protein